jgi:uncharacterized membrane protein YkvA (DUF1232 family)
VTGWWHWALPALIGALAVYIAFVLVLVVAGRHGHARALVTLVPDCLVLLRRLVGDPAVPRRRKLALLAVIPYLALPIDLVPDFIPIAGYLDDAIVVALALRYALRGAPPGLIERHWPGPPESLAPVLRLVGRPAP